MKTHLPLSRVIKVKTIMTSIGISAAGGGADLTALKARVTALESAVPLKANSSQLGYALISVGTVNSNGRAVYDNPFGNSVPVIVEAEIQINGAWGQTGFLYSPNNGGYGTKASYAEGTGIVLQTGSFALVTGGAYTGTPLQPTSDPTSAPCRIHVWKVTN